MPVKKTIRRKRTYRPRKSYSKKRSVFKNAVSQGYVRLNRKCWLVNARNDNTSTAGSLGAYPVPSGTGINTHISLATPESSGNGTYSCGFAIKGILSDLVSYSDFSAMADRYRIDGLICKIRFNGYAYSTPLIPYGVNALTGMTGMSYGAPYLEYVFDYDDAVAPTSNATWRQKSGVKTKNFTPGKCVVLKCKPKPVITGEDTGAADSQMIVGKGGWIDSANTNVPHFGIKGMIHNLVLPVAAVNNDVSFFTFDTMLIVSLKDFQ